MFVLLINIVLGAFYVHTNILISIKPQKRINLKMLLT